MTPFDEALLDNPGRRTQVDGSDLLRALATAGAQVRRGTAAAAEAGIGRGRVTGGERPRAVHVAAVGGSETVGCLLDLLVSRTSPVLLSRGGSGPLPGWVGPLDLVVAVSLSGSAVGPVEQAREAGRRGAYVLTVGGAGSPLADAAAAARGLHVDVDAATVAAHSRTALWALAVPTLLAAADAGVLELDPAVLEGVADRLDDRAEAYRPDAEHFVNPAKALAVDLAAVTPVLLGDGLVTGAAAQRAGAMLARTARTPATWGRLPDAAAQVVACLSGPLAPTRTAPDGGRDIFADPYLDGPEAAPLGLLLLRDPVPGDDAPEPERVRHNLAQAVHDHAASAGTQVLEVVAEPGHDLERAAELMALVDFAATYLAIGHGLDPADAPGVGDVRLPQVEL